MAQPLTIAEDLQERYGERLRSSTGGLSEIELQGVIRDARAGLQVTQGEAEQATLWNLIGLARTRQSRRGSALDAYLSAARLMPSVEVYWLNVALALLEMALPGSVLEQLANARRSLGPAYPLSSLFHCVEARALAQTGATPRARAIANTLMAASGRYDTQEMFNLALVYADIGDDDDAMEALARVSARRRGVARGEAAAVEFVREDGDLHERLSQHPEFGAVLERASAEFDAPLPAEALLPAEVALPPAAWNRVLDLVAGDDGAPPEAAGGASRP